MNWMAVNFATGLIMIVLLFFGILRKNLNEMIPLCFFIIMINTFLDYYLNRNLYFPIGIKKSSRTSVFVAARFTTALNSNSFDDKLKVKIEAIHDIVHGLNIVLFSSHISENYGNNIISPHDFVYRDISEISQCDIFIALLDDGFSTGVFIELGWASFLGKKIIIFIPTNFAIEKAPMIKGLSSLASYYQLITYNDLDNLKTNLKTELQAMIHK